MKLNDEDEESQIFFISIVSHFDLLEESLMFSSKTCDEYIS